MSVDIGTNFFVPARTWPAFKAIFLTANKEIREMQSLTGHMGYANNVSHDLFKQTSRELSVIVASTAIDSDAVANYVTNTVIITTKLQKDYR